MSRICARNFRRTRKPNLQSRRRSASAIGYLAKSCQADLSVSGVNDLLAFSAHILINGCSKRGATFGHEGDSDCVHGRSEVARRYDLVQRDITSVPRIRKSKHRTAATTRGTAILDLVH